jgi:Outer membrane protein beta-barrel domain
MKRTFVSSVLTLAAITGVAMPAHAQRRASVGVAAGATVPLGDLGDATSTGYHVLGTIAISGTAGSPLGFRVDGMYNSLSGKSSGPDLNIWTVNGNLVFAFPGGMAATPYLIGGAGWYNSKTNEDDAESTNNFGLNGGIGARFALSGFSTFAEVRFHNIFGEKNEATDERPSLRMIPLTFGILF